MIIAKALTIHPLNTLQAVSTSLTTYLGVGKLWVSEDQVSKSEVIFN